MDPFFQPVSGMDLPRFAGIPTFMRLPLVGPEHPRRGDVEIGLVGLPYDGGTSNRPGARHGPRALRDASTMIRAQHGITGIRPTSGRVPRTGHIVPYGLGALDALTTLGPMARKVEDLILTLPIISGVDWQDPAIVPMPLGAPNAVELNELRVAFFTDNGIATPTTEIQQAVVNVAQIVAGEVASLEERLPSVISKTADVFNLLWGTFAQAWRQKLLQRAGTIDTISPDVDEKLFSPLALANATEQIAQFQHEMLSFMADYDILLCPVNAYPALPHNSEDEYAPAFTYTMTFNLTGWPVVVIRAGTSPEGLPIGVQIVAHPWCEHEALAVAQQVEAAFGEWPRPPL